MIVILSRISNIRGFPFLFLNFGELYDDEILVSIVNINGMFYQQKHGHHGR